MEHRLPFGVKQERVMDLRKLSARASGVVAVPYDFVLEAFESEHRIKNHFDVVAGGGVAVEIERAGGLEDAVELDEAEGHHGEVRHHAVALPAGVAGEEDLERPHQVAELGRDVVAGHQLVVGGGGGLVPLPGVLERLGLGAARGPVLVLEEDVVVGLGVERGVEVDQVYGLVLDVLAHDREVVAVEELVPPFRGLGHDLAVF